MRNRLMSVALLATVCAATPAIADHESPSKILAKFAANRARLHVLKPAATVRPIEQSQNATLRESIESSGSTVLRNAVWIMQGSPCRAKEGPCC